MALFGASLLTVSGCSALTPDDSEAVPRDAAYLATGGVLLDSQMEAVGEVVWPEGASRLSIADDGDLVFSSSKDATESSDSLGPNMVALYRSTFGEPGSRLLFGAEAGVHDFSPAWSPSGDEVAFIRRAGPTHDSGDSPEVQQGIYVYDVVDDEVRLLHPGEYFAVHWSSDGAFVGGGQTNRIDVIDAGSGERVESVDAELGYLFAWSPSGNRIAMTTAHGDRTALSIYDIDSGKMSVLPNTATFGTIVEFWGPADLLVRLNRGGGAYLWSSVDWG